MKEGQLWLRRSEGAVGPVKSGKDKGWQRVQASVASPSAGSPYPVLTCRGDAEAAPSIDLGLAVVQRGKEIEDVALPAATGAPGGGLLGGLLGGRPKAKAPSGPAAAFTVDALDSRDWDKARQYGYAPQPPKRYCLGFASREEAQSWLAALDPSAVASATQQQPTAPPPPGPPPPTVVLPAAPSGPPLDLPSPPTHGLPDDAGSGGGSKPAGSLEQRLERLHMADYERRLNGLKNLRSTATVSDAELRARFQALKQGGGGTDDGGRPPAAAAAAAAERRPLDFGHIGDDEIEELLAAAQEEVHLTGVGEAAGDGLDDSLLHRLVAGAGGEGSNAGGGAGGGGAVDPEGFLRELRHQQDEQEEEGGHVDAASVQGLLREAKAALAAQGAQGGQQEAAATPGAAAAATAAAAAATTPAEAEEHDDDDPVLRNCATVLRAVGAGVGAGADEGDGEDEEQVAAVLEQARLWAREGGEEEEGEKESGRGDVSKEM